MSARKTWPLVLLLAIFVSALSPSPAHASACTSQVETFGSFFQNYESVEYSPDGLLIIHLKLSPEWATGRTWYGEWRVLNDECDYGNDLSGNQYRRINVPSGITDFSIRFSSPTHYDIWNDASSTPIVCVGCSVDIPNFPEYYSFGYLA